MISTKRRFLTIILLFFVLLSAIPAGTSAESSAADEWMKDVDGATRLSAMSIPGTHDSATEHVGLRYIFQCQDRGIAEQLENGYRYLDIRLALDGDTLILKHNFSKCRKSASLFSKALSLDDVLSDAYAFLEAHPSETVIMCVKAENGKDDVARLQTLLYDAISANEGAWYLKNRIPTLDEVRGKIVLATRFEDLLGLGEEKSGLHFYWEDQGDRSILAVPHAQSPINDSEALFVQDRYNYAVQDKLDAIEHCLVNSQASEESFFLNFCSTSGSGKVGHPKKYAESINEYLRAYDWDDSCCYGVVIVDFAAHDIAELIYNTNF